MYFFLYRFCNFLYPISSFLFLLSTFLYTPQIFSTYPILPQSERALYSAVTYTLSGCLNVPCNRPMPTFDYPPGPPPHPHPAPPGPPSYPTRPATLPGSQQHPHPVPLGPLHLAAVVPCRAPCRLLADRTTLCHPREHLHMGVFVCVSFSTSLLSFSTTTLSF